MYLTFVLHLADLITQVINDQQITANYHVQQQNPHSFIHSFILHSVNPYKVINNLEDIELVLLLIQ